MAEKKRTPLKSPDDMSDEDKAKFEYVVRMFERANNLHSQYRDRWNVYYGLYRNYRKLGNDLRAAPARDRGSIAQEFVRIFGAELFIPYCFATVETVVPRVLSNDPTMLVQARMLEAEESIEPVKAIYGRDQAATNYELKLQDTCRSGLMYGLGWQKTYWDKRYRKGKKFEPRILGRGEKVTDDRKMVYEGPNVESPDIFDMFWDPAGKDVETCDYIIHRTWRTGRYIADRVKAGDWYPIDLETLAGMRSDTDRGDMWQDRMRAAGVSGASSQGDTDLHEVLECHDRSRVYTILDRSLIVQDDVNPYHHGDLPFQIYRPTRVPSEFAGIGEIEPIAHLQFELNTLRSQRRDAATLALNRGYFYQKGAIQKRDMVTGPGAMVPTTMDPREAIYPMPIQDIPASSVEEETAIKNDITLTTGISETVAGTDRPTASTTATQVQMVQAAAGERIKLQAKNLVKETIKPAAAQWRELYIQNFPRKSKAVRVPDASTPSGYSFIEIGRKDFENVDVIPDAGSIAPENEAEKRANAVQFTQALAPLGDLLKPEKIAEHVLSQYGIKGPESWIKTEDEQEAEPEGPPGEAPEGEGPPAGAGPGQGPPAEQPAEAPPEQEQADPAVVTSMIQKLGQGLQAAGMPPDQIEAAISQAAQAAEPGSPDSMLQELGKVLIEGGMPEEAALAVIEGSLNGQPA